MRFISEFRCFYAALLVIGLFFLASCSKEKEELVWEDEFDVAGAPDSSRWSFDLGSGVDGWGNNEQQYYTSEKNNARVEDGLLIIEAQKDSSHHQPFTSARLISKKKGDWLLCRVEVKAKVPKGKGTWAAIWMMPTDWKYGGWPASGEIDIMEHVGYDPGVVHGTIHSEAYNHIKQTQKEGKIKVSDIDNNFHVYGINWKEDAIDFTVDGKPYHSFKKDSAGDYKTWPFDQRFHMILNLAVGGNWGGKEGVDQDIWPQKLEVDYVRVYRAID